MIWEKHVTVPLEYHQSSISLVLTPEWISLTAVLLLLSDVAAARSCVVQPSVVDLHASTRAVAPVLVPRHGVPQRHADLQQRQESEHGAPDGPYTEVLLLGRQSAE